LYRTCKEGSNLAQQRSRTILTTENKLIQALLSTEVKGDLLVLFHKSPGLIDTIGGVARRIGRKATLAERDVRELLSLGVLNEKKIGGSEVLFLDRKKDRELLESLANHLKTVKMRGAN
jgi:hypothetical protein